MPTNHWQRWKGIMKCYPFEEKRLAKWQPPYIVQPKYDGWRCRAVPTDNGYILLSSEENIIFSVPHINMEFNSLQLNQEYDGELYCHGMSFEQIESICSRSTNRHPNFNQIQFHVFDVVDFEKTQVDRLMDIERLKAYYSPIIKVSPFYIAENLDDIKRIYDTLIKEKYEGIIVRHIAAAYQAKRSLYVMKFKPKKTDTYKIVGWKEEISKDGIPKGRIGSLILSSQTGDEFGVSAGFDHEMKGKLWMIRDELSGKNATVHYQHLTDKGLPKGTFNVEVEL